MNMFTCAKCGGEWPENYCTQCSQTIDRTILPQSSTAPANGLPPPLSASNAPPTDWQAVPPKITSLGESPQIAVKPTEISCDGNFLVSQLDARKRSGYRTVASTRGGLTIGNIYAGAGAIVLRKRASFAVSVLLFIISLVGAGLLLALANAILGSRLPQIFTPECMVPAALIIASGIPAAVAWRVGRFQRTIEINELTRVEAGITQVRFEIQRSSAAEVGSTTIAGGVYPTEMSEKLIFSPFKEKLTTELVQVLQNLGIPVHERGKAEQAEFAQRLSDATPRAWVTPVILGINVIVFLWMCVSDSGAFQNPSINFLLRWGADFGPLTVTGQQWWRLLTCCFVHGGFFHILFNMLALWQAGRTVEKLLGNWFFLAVYLGCGLVGSLTSIYFQPQLVSVGASGAIFGVYGALLGYSVRQHEAMPREIRNNLIKFGAVFVLYNVISGINSFVQSMSQGQGPHIDLAAHAGGLVSGLLFGFMAGRPLELASRRAATKQQALQLAGSMVAMAVLLFPPVFRNGQHNLGNYRELAGRYAAGEGVAKDSASFAYWLQRAAELGDVSAQKTLGAIYYRGEGVEKNIDEAIRWMTKAAEQNDTDAEKFLAGIYFSGQGVPINTPEGIKWLTKLSDQGADQDCNDIEKALGLAYCSGTGVPQNLAEGVKWLTKVANRGDEDAQAKLRALGSAAAAGPPNGQ